MVFFLAPQNSDEPVDYYIFNYDLRNNMKKEFEEYGEYYKIHEDAGFLASDEELVKIHKILQKRNQHIVGVFHSHQRHPAIFSKVDIELHPSQSLWHLIISLRNIDMPQIKIFTCKENTIGEIKIQLEE